MFNTGESGKGGGGVSPVVLAGKQVKQANCGCGANVEPIRNGVERGVVTPTDVDGD
jgi:hypothetical protein